MARRTRASISDEEIASATQSIHDLMDRIALLTFPKNLTIRWSATAYDDLELVELSVTAVTRKETHEAWVSLTFSSSALAQRIWKQYRPNLTIGSQVRSDGMSDPSFLAPSGPHMTAQFTITSGEEYIFTYVESPNSD